MFSGSPELDSEVMKPLARVVVLQYDRTSDILTSRKEMFTKKERNIKNMLTTQVALREHAKRATYMYQDGFCCGQLLVAQPLNHLARGNKVMQGTYLLSVQERLHSWQVHMPECITKMQLSLQIVPILFIVNCSLF